MKKWFDVNKNNLKRICPMRKLEAFFILLFVAIYYFYSQKIILVIFALLFALFFIFDLINYFSKGRNKLSKLFFKIYPKKKLENKFILTDATLFFLSTILIILVFPKEAVILALIIYCFCDQAERVFGILMPSKRLFWDKSKNWAGTIMGFILAFFSGGIAIILLNLPFSVLALLTASVVVSLAGTVRKSYSFCLEDDNIIMPWIAAIILSIFLRLQ